MMIWKAEVRVNQRNKGRTMMRERHRETERKGEREEDIALD